MKDKAGLCFILHVFFCIFLNCKNIVKKEILLAKILGGIIMKVKRLRKVVALALSAMLCIGAVGCAKDVSSSADAAKTEIVYASTKDIMLP